MRNLLSLLCVLPCVLSNTECIWVVGKVECPSDPLQVKNTVIELWDKDGPRNVGPIDALDEDDKAGLSVVDNDEGVFKVEGCASDFDWLGPLYRNQPEFYLKIRHKCNMNEYKEMTVFPPSPYKKVFAPIEMTYYMDHPIQLE